MKNWYFVAVAPFLAACLLGSCSISDQDRCTSGFTYDPTLKACQAVPDASAAGADVAVSPADSAVGEAGGGATFGTTCATKDDCTSATTNYCVILPGSASGYCSKAQCTNECPSDYRCCNCPALSLVLCLTSSDATKATAGYGCSCS